MLSAMGRRVAGKQSDTRDADGGVAPASPNPTPKRPTRNCRYDWAMPQNTVKVEGEAAKKVVKLLELLEDNDDVQNVWANADISDRELEQMGA